MLGHTVCLQCVCDAPAAGMSAVRLWYACRALQCSGCLQRDSLRYVCGKLVIQQRWWRRWWLSVIDPLSTAVYYSSCCLHLWCVTSTVRLRCTCGTSAVRVQYGSCLQRDSLRCIYSRLAVCGRLVAVNWLSTVDQLRQIGCLQQTGYSGIVGCGSQGKQQSDIGFNLLTDDRDIISTIRRV